MGRAWKRLVLGVAVAGLGTSAAAQTCKDTAGVWDGEVVLNEASKFTVQWRFEGDEIVLAISAENAKWVGFGLSEETSGSMLGADIITGRFEPDGKPIVEDRFVPWQAFPFAPYGTEYTWHDKNTKVQTSPTLWPVLDCEQDWAAEGGSQAESCTLVVARRALVTKDSRNDRPIVAGSTARVIWALGSTASVSYHGAQRGSTTLSFSSPTASLVAATPNECSVEPNNCTVVNLTMSNYEIPAQETTYACQSFELGDQEAHVIKIEPIIDNAPHVHHILLHICNNGEFFGTHLSPKPCGGGAIGDSALSAGGCQSLMFAWAIGGAALALPKEAGFPVGKSGSRFLMVEIHYDNPARVVGARDSTTIRLTTTTDKRAHDAGVLVAGDVTTGLDDLKKGDALSHRVAECPGECTKTWREPINVFASFLHMHSFGRRIWTNRVDSTNKLQETTNSVEFWNFGFQQVTPVSFKVNPGDSLFVHCEYDTAKWPADVKFGSESLDEMCMDFLFYWPLQRENATICGGILSTRNFFRESEVSETDISEIFAAYPDFASKMALSLCGERVIAEDHFMQNIGGFQVPVQRTDPTWNGTHYQRNFEFASSGEDCSGGPPAPSPVVSGTFEAISTNILLTAVALGMVL